MHENTGIPAHSIGCKLSQTV